MKKLCTLLLLMACIPGFNFAQHTFTNGSSSLEIGGYIISYYQWRSHFPGDKNPGDYKKNTFALDDARFELKGYVKGRFRYNVEMNFADLVALAINGVADIKHAPVTEANIAYINPYVNVKVGYMKLPFSQSSNADKIPLPFLSRATLSNGDYYSRRDVGVMLYRDFWKQRIVVAAGIYSGMGEQIFLGDNDKSGKLEYVGRVQLCTSHYREEEFDKVDHALPTAMVAGGVRYSEKSSFTGNGTSDWAVDNTKTVDGKKLTFGVDAGFMWHGFSAQFEMVQARITPHDNTTLATTLKEYNTNYYRNGGYLVQANYYYKPAMSGVAVRYDEFNPNDLTVNAAQRTLGLAYNFIYSPYNLTIKACYDISLKNAGGTRWAPDQFRLGVQYVY